MRARRPAALRRGEGQQRAVHGRRGPQEAQQEQEAGQEVGQEVRRVPRVGGVDQADSPPPGAGAQQGGQVPGAALPPGVDGAEDRRGQGHHQVPDEKGTRPPFRRAFHRSAPRSQQVDVFI